jgi:tetratricopeptide (TPR) repeat protein
LANSYGNIGSVYVNMNGYTKALEIRQIALPANHPDLATSYNNTGSMYNKMGDYSKAFSYFERARDI